MTDLPAPQQNNPLGEKTAKLYHELKKRILSGRIEPGERLPSETVLVRRFGISRSTVIRAIHRLRDEGLVQSRQGSGHYATPNRHDTKGRMFFGLLSEMTPEYDADRQLVQLQLQLDARMQMRNASLIIYSTGLSEERALQATDAMIAQKVAGVFFIPMEVSHPMQSINQRIVNRFQKAGVAVVLLDRDLNEWPRRSMFDLICSNHRMTGYIVTEHLLKLGHRRLAFVGVNRQAPAVSERFLGFHEAHQHAGISANEQLIWQPEEHELTDQWVSRMYHQYQPDAIVCKSDKFAQIVLHGLLQIGLSIPNDVCIAGMGNEKFSATLSPPLTSVETHMATLAEVAETTMFRRVQTPQAVALQLTINSQLMARASTMPQQPPSQ